MLKVGVTLLFLLSLISFASASPKVLGGTVANAGQFPYIVRLFISADGITGGFCDGSIIDAYHVVSAAHCFQEGFRGWPYDIQVNYGAVNINESSVKYPISYTVHPEYSNTLSTGGTLLNDVALLRFATPFVYSTTVNKIEFEDDNPDKNDAIYVSGYGVTETGSVSQTLLWTALEYKDLDHCEDAGFDDLDDDQHVCAQGEAGHTACNGDSGGPLVTASDPLVSSTHKLLGIVSYGSSNCSAGFPSIYASVPGFAADWVEDQVTSKPNCRSACRNHFFICRVLGILPQSNDGEHTTCKDFRRRCNKTCKDS